MIITVSDVVLWSLLSLIAYQASLICVSLTMAMLHVIRSFDSDAIFHLGIERLCTGAGYSRVQVVRLVFLTDVPEFVAAAVVVVLTTACR